MTPIFKRCLEACGLSQKEAAEFLGVKISTVKQWSSGRRQPFPGAWHMLADLFEQVQDASEGALEVMAKEGLPSGAFHHLAVDDGTDELPTESACEMAGAMAMLMYLHEQKGGYKSEKEQ